MQRFDCMPASGGGMASAVKGRKAGRGGSSVSAAVAAAAEVSAAAIGGEGKHEERRKRSGANFSAVEKIPSSPATAAAIHGKKKIVKASRVEVSAVKNKSEAAEEKVAKLKADRKDRGGALGAAASGEATPPPPRKRARRAAAAAGEGGEAAPAKPAPVPLIAHELNPPLDSLAPETLKKAVASYVAYLVREEAKGPADLTSRGRRVRLTIDLVDMPTKPMHRLVPLPVPHSPLWHFSTSFCLFVRDPVEAWAAQFDAQWDPQRFAGMDPPKLVGLEELRRVYSQVSHKRDLMHSCVAFFCDRKIIEQAIRYTGAEFVQRQRFLRAVKLSPGMMLQELEEALKCTHLRIGTGTTVSVLLGFASDRPKEIYKNLVAVLAQLKKFFSPGPWDDEFPRFADAYRMNSINAVSLSSSEGISLPVWRRVKH